MQSSSRLAHITILVVYPKLDPRGICIDTQPELVVSQFDDHVSCQIGIWNCCAALNETHCGICIKSQSGAIGFQIDARVLYQIEIRNYYVVRDY